MTNSVELQIALQTKNTAPFLAFVHVQILCEWFKITTANRTEEIVGLPTHGQANYISPYNYLLGIK